MGVLTDFFVADDRTARQYGAGAFTPTEGLWKTKGITSLELSFLWAILERTPWDGSMIDRFTSVTRSGLDETVENLPDEMVSKLARLTEDAAYTAASRWANVEELVGNSPQALRNSVQELAKLARLAQSRKRRLYLWNSL